MPSIRPSSELRNKYKEIAEFCKTHHEPVFITNNGSGELVVMSNEDYDRIINKQDLYYLLEKGLRALAFGERDSAADVLADLEHRFDRNSVE